MSNINRWFAVQVDRDFESIYGEGKPRLYINNTHSYKSIDGVKYNADLNKLTVKDDKGIEYILENEPNQDWFMSTIYAHWKKVDEQFGKLFMEDRSDYEPWSYNSIKSLATELKLTNEPGVVMFYKKLHRS